MDTTVYRYLKREWTREELRAAADTETRVYVAYIDGRVA
jgi:endo-alpha-1,4-polygalactosaminidase (GH114 family)